MYYICKYTVYTDKQINSIKIQVSDCCGHFLVAIPDIFDNLGLIVNDSTAIISSLRKSEITEIGDYRLQKIG